jgi:SET domain-containing protein
MALLEKLLEIKESNIPGAGQGLFTKEPIAKGARIIEYTGRIRKWKDVEKEDGNYYILFVTKNHVIDANRRKKSLARYINDAKGLQKIKGLANNTQFRREGLRIFVEATKDIPAGAELFVGYGKEYWDVIRHNRKIDAKLNASKKV